jgi:hypothetical protein
MRRVLLAAALSMLGLATAHAAALPPVEVWKSPYCGCCGKWVDHLRAAGFEVTVHHVDDLPAARAATGMPQRYGVPDLPGNVDEVVASESFHLPGYKGKFDSVHTGGPWYKGVRNQCRPKIYTHNEGFYYYFLGFRCCAESDGKPTDPRTPYQIKNNWKLERIERSAGITLDALKQRLDDKEKGRCTCKPGDILCNTICGTLLAPVTR